MTTLIIPCAGHSTRFPNVRPKWLFTHPDGSLMVEKAISGLNIDSFDRIIITVTREHCEKFEIELITKQLFEDKVELCILDDFTKSQSETVFRTIEEKNIVGSIVIKDSDNYIACPENSYNNFVVGVDLKEFKDVSKIAEKSFIIANEQNLLNNIVEKQIVSDIICVGVYGFESVEIFKEAYNSISKDYDGELYLSHIISYLINFKNEVFEYVKAFEYEDWGTFEDWQNSTSGFATYFVDIDGVLMKNCGKFGSFNWDTNEEVIVENVLKIKELQDKGAQIVLVSSRPEKYVLKAIELIKPYGLVPFSYLSSLNHAKRVLINDFSETNPYPSANAINIPRNSKLESYL